MNKDFKYWSDNRLMAVDVENTCLRELDMLNEKMGFYFKSLKSAQEKIKEADKELLALEAQGNE